MQASPYTWKEKRKVTKRASGMNFANLDDGTRPDHKMLRIGPVQTFLRELQAIKAEDVVEQGNAMPYDSIILL